MLDTVRAAGIVGFRRLVRSHGGDPSELLAAAGIDEALLGDPDRLVPYRKVLCALEQAAGQLAIPDLGLQLAAMQDLSILGPLALAAQAADTLRDGILTVARHMPFHTPGLAFAPAPAPEGHEAFAMRFLLPGLPPVLQATEHAVSHLARMAPLLTGGVVQPRAIHFRHGQLASDATYQRHLGQVPRFDAGFDGVVFDAAQLRRRIATNNPALRGSVEHVLIGVAPPAELPVGEQVSSTLASLMQVGPVGLEEVARVLRLHPRTLQRRLADAGLGFAELADTARRDLAQHLLAQPGVPLARVSQALGFADQAVLTRACRRWFGTTPRAKRRQIAAGEGMVPGGGIEPPTP